LCHYQTRRSGRLIVDFPTVVPSEHRSKLVRKYANRAVETFGMQPARISHDGGGLLPAVEELIELAQSEALVLSTGHATRMEVDQLIDLCAKRGRVRLLLNQPANPITGMTASQLKALGKHDWLYVEQTALTVALGYQTEADLFDVLQNVHNVVYSSDFGQQSQPGVDEWWASSKTWFQRAQLSPGRIADISLANPLRLLAP